VHAAKLRRKLVSAAARAGTVPGTTYSGENDMYGDEKPTLAL
jgi:hypothetical protein